MDRQMDGQTNARTIRLLDAPSRPFRPNNRVILSTGCKVWNPNLTVTFWSQNRGRPWVMCNTCVKYHYCKSKGKAVMQKWWKVWSPLLTLTFDLLTPKSIEPPPPSCYDQHVWSIIILSRKEKRLLCRNYSQSDGQTAMVNPVYPQNQNWKFNPHKKLTVHVAIKLLYCTFRSQWYQYRYLLEI